MQKEREKTCFVLGEKKKNRTGIVRKKREKNKMFCSDNYSENIAKLQTKSNPRL